MDFSDVIIYGAYGYTGKLIVDLAVSKGYKPAIGGRSREKTEALAAKYNLPFHVFDCADQSGWDAALKGKKLLLNCAGPFSLTIKDILPACIRNKVHYTDINGEIVVFEFVSKYDKEARELDITLLPGTGFDVVPTDCLALFLKEQLPDATHLELSFFSQSGLSRGTALSVLNRFHQGSSYRRDGKIVLEPIASVTRTLRMGGKDRLMAGITWGDIFTAFHTTGIPNIRVYTGMAPKMVKTMQRVSKFSWLVKRWPAQQILRSMVKKKIDGPSEEKRERLTTYLWGQVRNAKGKAVTAQMETPESYKLTAITAITCAEGVLAGKAPAGYCTPAKAFGSDLIMQVSGVKRNIV